MPRDPEPDESEKEEPVEVPYTRLPPQVLRALIEEFVTREGTDYGLQEKTLEDKVADVRRQLERGEAKIFFDMASQTANIVPRR